MTDQAVAVWTAEGATRALTRSVNGKKGRAELAALLGVEEDTERGKAMLDRFVTVALHAAVSDPKIIRATRESIVQSIRDSALLGLEPVGVTGDGAIVVYDEKVKEEVPGRHGGTIIVEKKIPTAHFQPMYRGLLKLARRSDQLAHIDAHVVYEGDKIELDLGSQPRVSHYPVLDGNARGEYVGAYAVAELTNGRRYVEWMTTADIEIVRKSSRGGQATDSPWVRFWAEMARKTVLRRLMKRLPLETMAEHGLRLEAELESRGSAPALEAGAPAEAPAESSARRRLRERFVPPAETVPDGPAPAAPPASDSEPDTPASEGDPAVSGRPTASEPSDGASETTRAVAGEVVDDQERQERNAPTVSGSTNTSAVGPGDIVGSICGATSDPELGDVETCILPPGHTYPDSDKLNPHESKERSRWPNRGK